MNQKVCYVADPDVIRTRNLLIWSQTRYRCATESLLCTRLSKVKQYSRIDSAEEKESRGKTQSVLSLACIVHACCVYV